MNPQNVLALINAGFPVDEVRRMMADPAEPEAPAEPAPAPDPEPEPAPDPAPAPGKDPVELLQTIEALRQQIEDLRSTFSAAAVRQDNFGGPEKETVGDVLAAIINPKTKKEV